MDYRMPFGRRPYATRMWLPALTPYNKPFFLSLSVCFHSSNVQPSRISHFSRSEISEPAGKFCHESIFISLREIIRLLSTRKVSSGVFMSVMMLAPLSTFLNKLKPGPAIFFHKWNALPLVIAGFSTVPPCIVNTLHLLPRWTCQHSECIIFGYFVGWHLLYSVENSLRVQPLSLINFSRSSTGMYVSINSMKSSVKGVLFRTRSVSSGVCILLADID